MHPWGCSPHSQEMDGVPAEPGEAIPTRMLQAVPTGPGKAGAGKGSPATGRNSEGSLTSVCGRGHQGMGK